MFGHQNNDDTATAANGMPPADTVSPPHEPETFAPTAATPAASSSSSDYMLSDLPHASAAPAVPSVTPAAAGVPAVNDSAPSTPNPAASGDLLELKQAALHELSPLIGHLEQTPEEKFRTTMMMIQASDDQSMLPTALAAAKEIGDEKARAQALLDIVNEINYFTQQHETTA